MPIHVAQLGSGKGNLRIRSVHRGHDHWIALDEHGALWHVSLPAYEVTQLLKFHAGAVNAAIPSRLTHHVFTAGQDMTLRWWDSIRGTCPINRAFNTPVTALTAVPPVIDQGATVVTAGFADGVVRVLVRGSENMQLQEAVKPHTRAISHLVYSPDASMLATVSSDDRTVFFFKVGGHASDISKGALTPLGFVVLVLVTFFRLLISRDAGVEFQ